MGIKHPEIDQYRRHHQTQNGRAADIFKHRHHSPDFGQRESQGHDDRQSANHVLWQQSRHCRDGDNRRDTDKQR
jgi:hypothetical protein